MDPIVMVPGLGSDRTVWQPTIAQLGSDHACHIGDTFSDASLEGMARRILDSAPDRFALAGVSMGGMIAITIIGLAPERVTRLALFDTNAHSDSPEQIERRHATNAAMLAATDLRTLSAPAIGYMVHPAAGDDVRQALTDMAVRVGASAYVRQNEAVAARADLFPLLARITVATLVAVGDGDLMTPPALSRAIAEAIPNAEFHLIPDCGHLPPLEKPAATAALIRRWLSL